MAKPSVSARLKRGKRQPQDQQAGAALPDSEPHREDAVAEAEAGGGPAPQSVQNAVEPPAGDSKRADVERDEGLSIAGAPIEAASGGVDETPSGTDAEGGPVTETGSAASETAAEEALVSEEQGAAQPETQAFEISDAASATAASPKSASPVAETSEAASPVPAGPETARASDTPGPNAAVEARSGPVEETADEATPAPETEPVLPESPSGAQRDAEGEAVAEPAFTAEEATAPAGTEPSAPPEPENRPEREQDAPAPDESSAEPPGTGDSASTQVGAGPNPQAPESAADADIPAPSAPDPTAPEPTAPEPTAPDPSAPTPSAPAKPKDKPAMAGAAVTTTAASVGQGLAKMADRIAKPGGEAARPVAALVNSGAPTGYALALAGALPFAIGALAQWVSIVPADYAYLTLPAVLWYGAVILSFLGGIRWGLALRVVHPPRRARLLVLSVFPALLGWSALFLPPEYAVMAMIVGFSGQGAWDVATAEHSGTPTWYAPLRLLLTLIVVGCLVLILLGISEPLTLDGARSAIEALRPEAGN